ncbi:hypothetical protein V2G26_003776 [Clonostachys chloroleuca]
MAEKDIAFITGANTGIGFEVVKALLQSPKAYHILLGSRSLEKGKEAISQLAEVLEGSSNTVELVEIDVTVDETINKAAELVETKFGRLDALVNNAGAAFDKLFTSDATDFRTLFNKSYDVNVSGAQVTTAAFAPLLIKSKNARLLFLTSGTANLTGHEQALIPARAASVPKGWPKEGLIGGQAYKACKTALNMVMITWHWFLKDDGVKVWSISPGMLATNLTGNPELLRKAGAGEPSLGGDLIKRVLEGERDADVARVVTQNGAVQPW